MATAALVEHAHAAGKALMGRITREEQKAEGQFWTPPSIALFMARRLVAGVDTRPIRVLEPAAGAGILAGAVLEALIERPLRPSRVELLLCEKDSRLLPTLEAFTAKALERCAEAGIDLDVCVEPGDFLLSERVIKGDPIEGLLTISNPPFYKLNKSAAQAQAHLYAVHGQPNVYGLFMAACARLTGKHGRWCFITPRSWMSGTYFGAVRRTILKHLSLESLHAFESRTDGFAEDEVLQETVIAWAAHRPTVQPGLDVLLTRSAGASDLADAQVQALPIERLLDDADGQTVISIPADGHDPFEGWTATLATYGLQVSTGPVVAFRATEYIRQHAEQGTVPLLWMQHVKQQSVHWPVAKKREHIKAVGGSAWMMVKNEPMVLMHRFSPNEAERRVRCAAYEGGLPADVIGLENHLNYIFRPGGSMTVAEVRGLSAFLASDMVDRHFRAIAGSTQVNARDLRALPLPPLATIMAIGDAVGTRPTLAEIDRIVGEMLGTSADLRTSAWLPV